MDLKTRQAFIRQLASVYQKATKKERGKILDQAVIATGYHRFRASWLLTHPPISPKSKLKRIRKSKYAVIVSPLTKIYGISNFASGKRLVGMIPSYVETMILHGFRYASPVVSSSSTISDRPLSCCS